MNRPLSTRLSAPCVRATEPSAGFDEHLLARGHSGLGARKVTPAASPTPSPRPVSENVLIHYQAGPTCTRPSSRGRSTPAHYWRRAWPTIPHRWPAPLGAAAGASSAGTVLELKQPLFSSGRPSVKRSRSQLKNRLGGFAAATAPGPTKSDGGDPSRLNPCLPGTGPSKNRREPEIKVPDLDTKGI